MTPPPRTHPAADPEVPGCGLAVYVGLLAVGCLAGIVGITLATMQLFQGQGENGPQPYLHGGQVAVWQLAPMHRSRLIGVTEVPSGWHDESPGYDGEVACAMMSDRLVRIQEGQGTTIPYAELIEVSAEGDDNHGMKVTARSASASITCAFRMLEGGDRFERQLRAEMPGAEPLPAPP
jgi:hypothetical protein